MSQCRRKTIYRMVTKLCRNDVQTVHCRIHVVIIVSVMTCHWALVLVRRRRVETQASVCIRLWLQTINMSLDKVSRALLIKLLFFKIATIVVLLLFASIGALKNMERSSFHTGLEEHDSEVWFNWRFGNCSVRGRRPIAPEIVEEVTVAMAENAGRNVRSSRGPLRFL